MSRLRSLSFMLSFVIAGLVVPGAFAQAPGDKNGDLLDQVRRLNELKAQKMEADVREAIREADRIGKTDPAEAVGVLKAALLPLDDDLSLSQARKDALVQLLRGRIRQWSAEAGKTEQRDIQRDARIARPTAPRQEPPKPGSSDPARAAADRIKSTNERLADNKGVTDRGNQGTNAAGLDVARSNTLPKDQVDFPPDWRERINRSTRQGQKATTREKKILDALSKPIPANFTKDRFEDVILYLEKVAGVSILIDKQTIEQAGGSYDTPITIHAQEVSLRTVLRKVLGEVNMTYVVKDEAIQVVTREQAKDMLVTRSYQVGDLVGAVDMRLGPILGQVQMTQNIRTLIDLIQSTVEPSSWEVTGRGGIGTIVFYPPTMTLIVKNTAEVHYLLGGALR